MGTVVGSRSRLHLFRAMRSAMGQGSIGSVARNINECDIARQKFQGSSISGFVDKVGARVGPLRTARKGVQSRNVEGIGVQ